MKKVITFGTFDLLHEGHIRILERAKALGDYLIVGISTDKLNATKGKLSIFPQEQRLSYINALSCVDEVFLEESLEKKDFYIKKYEADLLVMGHDWEGKFDWVSCSTLYLPRTENISSTAIKTNISEKYKVKKILFGDTYIRKHYDCALSILNKMTSANIVPIFTNTKELPRGIDCDCIVYFNKPVISPPNEYKDKPKILIDHGASTLKWFLASKERYCFFDSIITAGPDHVEALLSFFPTDNYIANKVKSAGFIKSPDFFEPPKFSRKYIAKLCNLDANKPIILFAPTWHISANISMQKAISEISKLDNEVTSLHPETVNLDVSKLNVIDNINGMTLELMKHADCIISDTSSTLFEAAALQKPTIQILLEEYSDNNAILYNLPFVAGTADLFCSGILCRPDEIANMVSKILEKDETVINHISNMQNRILKGTLINNSVGDQIVSEIVRSCHMRFNRESLDNSIDNIYKLGLECVHKNMFYASNRIIAHGGGDFNKIYASNSEESISSAIKAVDIIEIDLVRSKDGIIVAHDGFEHRYNLKNKFKGISTNDFLRMKFDNTLSPISFEDAIKKCTSPNKSIVLDIKSVDDDYLYIVQQAFKIASSNNLLDQVLIQCYSEKDFDIVNEIGFKRTILPVWKYFYKDPLGDRAFQFIDHCFNVNSKIISGISIPYINKHMSIPSHLDSRFPKLLGYWKRIYIHGAPKNKYSEILRNHCGIFADSFSYDIEFKDVPPDFNWTQYLFLNKGLTLSGIDNQVSATIHFLMHGIHENRLYKYEVPNDFAWTNYISKNPDLRKGGITSVNSAKAHWTKYGQFENRSYT